MNLNSKCLYTPFKKERKKKNPPKKEKIKRKKKRKFYVAGTSRPAVVHPVTYPVGTLAEG